jgi:hypothetical protein
MALFTNLPNELILHVIDCITLAKDQKAQRDVKSRCLVSRQIAFIAEDCLYNAPRMYSFDRENAGKFVLCTVFSLTPDYVPSFTTSSFTFPASISIGRSLWT